MKKLKLFFGFHEIISFPHFNNYFLRHSKYFPVTQAPLQASAIYIYLNIQLPSYKKELNAKE